MDYSVKTNTEEHLEIEIIRRPNYQILLFTGLCTLAGMGVLLTQLHELYQFPYKLTEVQFLFLFLLVSSVLYVLKLFLWQWRGKEKVIMNTHELIIRRKGTFFSVPRKYELQFVGSFAEARPSPYPLWMRIFGIAGGQVEFLYASEPRFFGQTLDREQAQQMAYLLNERLLTGSPQS